LLRRIRRGKGVSREQQRKWIMPSQRSLAQDLAMHDERPDVQCRHASLSRSVSVARLQGPLPSRGISFGERRTERNHPTKTSSRTAIRGASNSPSGGRSGRRFPPLPAHGRDGTRSDPPRFPHAHPARINVSGIGAIRLQSEFRIALILGKHHALMHRPNFCEREGLRS